MQGAGIDSIVDAESVGSGFLLDIDRGVEMAAALEVVEQVAPALVQQVVVEGVFLVDWDLFLHNAVADVKTLGADEDDGAGLDQIGIVYGVGFRAIVLLGDGNLSQDALLFLKFFSQTLKRISDAGGGNAVTGVHLGDVLKLALGESCVAGEFDLADVGRFSGADVDENIDLLVGWVGSTFSGDARAIIAILLHQLADVSEGELEFVLSMKLAELELGGVDDLVGVGVGRSPFHVDGSNKEVERGGESEPHARAGRLGFGLDIGKAPSGEENADAFADLIAVERLSGFLREDL